MPIRTVALGTDPRASFGIQSPDDRFDYGFDCSGELLAGEALTAPLIVSSDELNTEMPAIAGAMVTVWISGGTPGTNYQIVAAVATSKGRLLSGSASLFVGPAGLDDPAAVAPAG